MQSCSGVGASRNLHGGLSLTFFALGRLSPRSLLRGNRNLISQPAHAHDVGAGSSRCVVAITISCNTLAALIKAPMSRTTWMTPPPDEDHYDVSLDPDLDDWVVLGLRGGLHAELQRTRHSSIATQRIFDEGARSPLKLIPSRRLPSTPCRRRLTVKTRAAPHYHVGTDASADDNDRDALEGTTDARVSDGDDALVLGGLTQCDGVGRRSRPCRESALIMSEDDLPEWDISGPSHVSSVCSRGVQGTGQRQVSFHAGELQEA